MQRAAGWQIVRNLVLMLHRSFLTCYLAKVIINNKEGLSDEALAWQGGVIMVSLHSLCDVESMGDGIIYCRREVQTQRGHR